MKKYVQPRLRQDEPRAGRWPNLRPPIPQRNRATRLLPPSTPSPPADLSHILLIRLPPSSRSTLPFSIGFSTTATASCAYSSAVPNRGGNRSVLARLARTLADVCWPMAVSNREGAIVTTRMPGVGSRCNT